MKMRFLFDKYDVDKSGVITKEDLTELAKSGKEPGFYWILYLFIPMSNSEKSQLNLNSNLFSDPTFDIDPETLKAFMDKCDVNGDGKISFDEFCKTMSTW